MFIIIGFAEQEIMYSYISWHELNIDEAGGEQEAPKHVFVWSCLKDIFK